MLVCRSPEAARSNGTVVLTWNNVAAGYDLFGAERRELFEGGYARVEKEKRCGYKCNSQVESFAAPRFTGTKLRASVASNSKSNVSSIFNE
jgi:hypothetical protein